MEYGLIGEHLPHSFSKEIHERLGDYEYVLHEVAKEELDSFMRSADFKGINVTIPYKQSVIPYLHEISERAGSIGAVNAITNKNGLLYGDNTDFGGMQALIRDHMGLDLSGKKVVILGTGGTSKTARAVAEALGAAQVLRVSRSGNEGSITYSELSASHRDADLIINATPCGMFPKCFDAPVSIADFPALSGVVDVIYNPLRTRLVLEARSRGIKAEGGLYMLVGQAVLAAEIFMDKKLPDGTIDEVYKEIFSSKENIVLTGMPGGGKSTIGNALAGLTGREVIDTDAEIVKSAGMPITEIFSRFGESYFRDLETEVIKQASQRSGCIISTGGGAILRDENIQALKMNGKIFFLDRDPSELRPSDDRPLSDTGEKPKALYRQRLPIYTGTADATVPVSGSPEDTAKAILGGM